MNIDDKVQLQDGTVGLVTMILPTGQVQVMPKVGLPRLVLASEVTILESLMQDLDDLAANQELQEILRGVEDRFIAEQQAKVKAPGAKAVASEDVDV